MSASDSTTDQADDVDAAAAVTTEQLALRDQQSNMQKVAAHHGDTGDGAVTPAIQAILNADQEDPDWQQNAKERAAAAAAVGGGGGSSTGDTSEPPLGPFKLGISDLEQRAADAATEMRDHNGNSSVNENGTLLSALPPRGRDARGPPLSTSDKMTLRAKTIRAERAFRALQRQVHTARAREHALDPEAGDRREEIEVYAKDATSDADAAAARALESSPTPVTPPADRTSLLEVAETAAAATSAAASAAAAARLGLEAGGCSAQKTDMQCDNLRLLWDETNGADGAHCSVCYLPRRLGGPQHRCMNCKAVAQAETRHWVCTPNTKKCKKEPKPPPAPGKVPEPPPHQDFYDSVDDNPMTEAIVKGVAVAGVTELANKLHFNLVNNLRMNVNASVSRGVGRTLTHSLVKDLTLELGMSLSQVLAETVTRVATRRITSGIVPSITHTLTATLGQALTRSPKSDYYCQYCKSHRLYCSMCYAATVSDYNKDYYSSCECRGRRASCLFFAPVWRLFSVLSVCPVCLVCLSVSLSRSCCSSLSRVSCLTHLRIVVRLCVVAFFFTDYAEYYTRYYTFYYSTVFAEKFSLQTLQDAVDAPGKPKTDKATDGLAYPPGKLL